MRTEQALYYLQPVVCLFDVTRQDEFSSLVEQIYNKTGEHVLQVIRDQFALMTHLQVDALLNFDYNTKIAC